MTADVGISGELKSLHEELSASQRERSSPAAGSEPVSGGAAVQAGQPAADEQQLRAALGKFFDAVAEFLHQADKDLAAHPVANVIGGIVVGILIGRLIGRR